MTVLYFFCSTQEKGFFDITGSCALLRFLYLFSSLSFSLSVCLSVRLSVSSQLYCSFQSNKPHLWKDYKVLIVIISCVCVCVCDWGSFQPQNSLDPCQNVWWPHSVSEQMWWAQLSGFSLACWWEKRESRKETKEKEPLTLSRGKQIQVRQEEPAPEPLQPRRVFRLCGFLVGFWLFLPQNHDAACFPNKMCAVLDTLAAWLLS